MSQPAPPTAVVTLEGRGDLPFLALHGVPLVLHVVTMLTGLRQRGLLGEVVVTADREQVARAERLVDGGADVVVAEVEGWWAGSRGGGVPLLLADPLCPLVPGAFAAALAGDGAGPPRAAYRPVTDTVKQVVDDHVAGTLDRDGYAIVTSPVLLPAGSGTVPTRDYGELVTWLRERGPVELVQAPSLGRRVGDAASVLLLECAAELTAAAER